jgi:hypothetical protein
MALVSTQPLTEVSTTNHTLGKGRPAGRGVRLKISLPSVNRLSRKCGSLDVSQFIGPPWAVTERALSFHLNIFDCKLSATLTLSSILPLFSSGPLPSLHKFHFHTITSVVLEPTILRNSAMLPIRWNIIATCGWQRRGLYTVTFFSVHC